MKKVYLALLLCCAAITGNAQTAASYLFSNTTGTYSDISSATGVVSSTALNGDDPYAQFAIGFNFTFCGTSFDKIVACSNGWIGFNNATVTSTTGFWTNGATGGYNANVALLMPFWDDLLGNGTTLVYYQVSGSAPNRVFTFQWGTPVVQWSTNSGSGTGTFQVKLYETSNVIQYVYGPSSYVSTATIGISNSGTDYLSLASQSATTASSSTYTTTISGLPAANTVFTFTPPPAAVATPSSLSFGPVNTGTSVVQTFSVTGANLSPASGSLTITAPTPPFYQVSSTGLAGSWGNTASIGYTGGALISVPVYVQFNPAALTSYTGNVTVTGGGLLAPLNVPVSGDGANACVGMPTAGVVTPTPASGGCTSFTTVLSLTGSSVAGGLAYQWGTSPDNTTWTPVAGATNPTYTTLISTPLYYNCSVTCVASTQTAATPGLLMTSGPSYAALPFFEGFEAPWINGCNTADIPNNYWRNTPATGNPSWRREDDAPTVNTAVWTSPTSYAYSPGGSASSHSARFHQGFTTGGGQGKLDLYVNLPAGTKQITYDYITGSATTGANNSVQLQISTDGGTVFTNIGGLYNGTGGVWTNKVETTTTASSTAILRWLTTSDFGSFDIGVDNVSVFQLLACTTPPNQPTSLVLTPSLFSIGGSFTASVPAADKYMVIMTTTATAPAAPVDGTNYIVGSTTLGGTVVSNGNTATFSSTGLTAGTHYWFWVYGYNSLCTGGPLYTTAPPLAGDIFTNTCSLTGIRTVGPTGDYPTLTAAMSAVMNNGLAGPLAIELQTTYDGTGETYPVVINKPPCGSATNTLTIRPQGTLTISYGAGTQPFIDLNGATDVIIDGRVGSTGTTKSLTIINTNTGGQAIRFVNGASNNIVRFCTVRSVNTSTVQGTIFFFTSTGLSGNNNNLIDNCDILDGPTTPVNAIYSTGTTGRENSGNTISNCNIANYFSPSSANYGIFLTTASTGWTITNNRFYQTATRTFTSSVAHRAINITNTAGNNFNITGNIIGFGSSTGTGVYTMNTSTTALTPTFQGIALSVGNATPTSVQGNTIAGINFTSASTTATAGGALCGISITAGSANIGNLVPNVIGAATGNGAITHNAITNTGGTIVGINGSAVNPAAINIQGNVIGSLTLINGSATLGGGIQGIQISSTGSYSVTGNTIGSTTTANSFYLSTVTTGTQLMYGINSATTTTNLVQPMISNNTIANMTALGTGTASVAAGIINTSNASATITGNTIYNISSATANTISTGQTGVEGIGYYGNTIPLAVITNNTIYSLANTNSGALATTVCGIGTTNAVGPQISGNKIYDLRNANTGTTATAPPRAIGILVGTPTTTGATVFNNMISLGNGLTTNTSFTGIMNAATATPVMRVYYNTVTIEGAAGSGALPTAAMLRGNYSATAFTTPMDIRNNIFNNTRTGGTGKHYAIANTIGGTASATGWAANASDYNILNGNAATIGFWTSDRSFANWKVASLSDNNSNTASTVTFVSSATGNLHINMGVTANNIESHGTPISGFDLDIDNQNRPGPTAVNGAGFAPDLGADEFDGVALSNLPPSITYTALTNACGTGDRVLTATIADGDVIPTTGALQPRIYFKKGVGGTWFSTQGVLASGTGTNGTWNFTISASLMGGLALNDQVFYHVIAQDGLGQITSVPGAGMVATDVNTVSTPPTTPNSYTILLSLSGTIPVGAASAAPFNTITSAVNAYNTGCLAGPVVFSLTDATYPTETFPITVQLNPFASAVNTLTIQPAAGTAVNINGLAASPAIFKFLNAKYVTLDGLNTGGASLGLNNNNTGASATVWFASTTGVGPGNKFITVKRTNIVGGTNAVGATSSWGFLSGIDAATPSTTAGPDNDNITIQGNSVTKVAYGIYAFGTALGSAGGLDNWLITGNTFGPAVSSPSANIMYNGMYMGSHMNPVISNNIVQNIGDPTLGSQVVGIFMTGLVNGAVISGNTVRNITSNSCSSGTGANFGIGIGSNNIVLNCSITGNTVYGISDVYVSGCGRSTGIMLNTSSGASNTVIANNMISDISAISWGSTTPAVTYMPAGIDIQGTSGGVKIYYNTVNMNTSLAGYNAPTATACLLMNNGIGSGIDVRNNIFNNTYNNTTVTTDNNYAIYSAVSNATFSNINYNDYYVVAPNPMGYLFGFQSNMAAMQSSFGGNANSINVAPTFVASNDLRLMASAGNLPLISGTPAINGTINIDFNGNTRSGTTPVMGAHEVVIVNCSGAVAGTATAATPVFCGSGITNISTAGTTQGLGVSYQWQSSTDSASWTNISGATSLTYSLPGTITNTTWYRIKVGCSFTSTFDSATAKVTINPYPTAITGPNVMCINSTYTLGSTPSGGVWSSSDPVVAGIDGTGVVATGAGGGNAIISYTLSTGCRVTSTLTVNNVLPVVSASATPGTVCEGGSSVLNGTSTNPGATAYTISSIPYMLETFTPTGTYTQASTPTSGSNDQGYYTISLPFPFTLYGNTFNTAYIGTNGYLSFSTGYTSDYCGTLPNTGFTTLVSAGGRDFNMAVAGASITYGVSGTAPNRKFIVHYNVHDWSPSTNPERAQIVLYETSNDIDVHIDTLSAGTGHVIGIQNATGTIAATVPGYNNNSGTSSPALGQTSYRFVMPTPTYSWTADPSLSVTDILTPTASPVNSTTTYTLSVTASNGCVGSATTTVSTNPIPSAIGGTLQVCEGLTTTLTDADGGGTWISGNTAVATVVSGTGVVTGVAAGTTLVSYKFTGGIGCERTAVLTVNPLPSSIGGSNQACIGGTTTLTNVDAGGTWLSNNTSVATIGSASGIVTGVSWGTSLITYTLPTGCIITGIASVNPLPVVNVAPTSPTTFCIGEGTAAYTASATMPVATLLDQNFNTSLGPWSVQTPVGTAVGAWQIVPSGFDGTLGDGTPMLQASPFMEGNQVITRLVSPSFSTVGFESASLTFNQYFLSDASDQVLAVEYSLNGGPWVSIIDYIGTPIMGTGVWSAASPEATIALPPAIVNQPDVKLRWHYNGALYGWFLDNIKVKATLPPATYTWSGGSDLSCTTCTNPTITPSASGTNVYTVTATSSASCTADAMVTINVNPLPAVIGGTLAVCEGLTTALTNADAGGTWVSGTTSVATIDGTTGVITGHIAGTSEITYTLPTGCVRTAIVTVNELPAVITGTMDVCEGLTTQLNEVTTGGTWISSNTTVATVDGTGLVTGNVAGTTTITYTITATGCIRTTDVVVNPLPAIIGGTQAVCEGLTTTLTNTSTGGTWFSSNTSTATIGSSSGIATGVLAGNVMVTYTLPTGCIRSAEVTVNALPDLITGTMDVCEGLTTQLNEVTTGGTWTSSNSTVATVDGTGLVTGNVAGTVTITYTITATGCIRTTDVVVNPLPAVIGGTQVVCEGLTTTLTNTSTGGTWISDNTSVATIGLSTGITTGVVAGTSMITYELPTGCIRSTEVTVNALPDFITGTPVVCEGLTTQLNELTAGGTWISGNTSVATVDGSGLVTGVAAGNAMITYTITATGCIRAVNSTVNPLPAVIGGTQAVCEGLTTTLTNTSVGGTWMSGNTFIATITMGSGIASGINAGNAMITYTLPTGCIRTTELTVNALPAAITGTAIVCEASTTSLADVTPGGSWSSSSTAMATVDGLGTVTGVSAGSPVITYMLSTGCIATRTVVVNPLPAVITGTMNVCEGLTTTLASTTPGGLWISGSTPVATVGASTGVVTGVSAGTVDITYAFGTGCKRTANVVVNATPAVITGPTQVCAASSVTLSDATTGGTWNSSNGAIATIGAGTGVVTGVTAGSVVMTYMASTGCIRTLPMTVNALPLVYNMTGGGSYCSGGTGVHIGMANSENGYTYNLYLGGTLMTSQPGTLGVVDFGPLTVGGVYTVQAVTGASCSSNMSGSATVTVIPLVTPAISLGSTPDDTVCAGTMTTFTATIANGGLTPAYAWQVNGVPVSSTGASHTYNPANGDVITVTMTSSEACPSPASVTATQTMVVVSNETPVSNIAAHLGVNTLTSADTICQGTTVLYSATSLFGGTAPVYTWYRNSVSTGVTGTSYAYAPVKGDVITVRLNSNYRCPIVNNVSSSAMAIKVDSVYIPVVDIVTNTGLDIKPGTPVTFTAIAKEAGSKPRYQWLKNSVAINGATSMTYSTSTLVNNDSVTCIVWGTGDCSDNTPTFNSVKMKVTTGIVQAFTGEADLRMVPNPNSGEFTVSGTFATLANAEVSLEVIDMLGQVVYKNTVMSKGGTLDQRVKLTSTLANGMYMLNVRSGGEIKTFHFVLKQ